MSAILTVEGDQRTLARSAGCSLPAVDGSFVVEAADGRVVTVLVERARVPVVVAWVPRWLASVVVVVGPVVASVALMWLGTR